MKRTPTTRKTGADAATKSQSMSASACSEVDGQRGGERGRRGALLSVEPPQRLDAGDRGEAGGAEAEQQADDPRLGEELDADRCGAPS